MESDGFAIKCDCKRSQYQGYTFTGTVSYTAEYYPTSLYPLSNHDPSPSSIEVTPMSLAPHSHFTVHSLSSITHVVFRHGTVPALLRGSRAPTGLAPPARRHHLEPVCAKPCLLRRHYPHTECCGVQSCRCLSPPAGSQVKPMTPDHTTFSRTSLSVVLLRCSTAVAVCCMNVRNRKP